MGTVLSTSALKVASFLKLCGLGCLHCWFGQDCDDCVGIDSTSSNAPALQQQPENIDLEAARLLRPAPTVRRPAPRATAPRPPASVPRSVYNPAVVAYARYNDIPPFLEDEDHADYIFAQTAPRRPHARRDDEPPRRHLNIGGVGNQQLRDQYRSRPSRLRNVYIPTPTPSPAASRHASPSRQLSVGREVPLKPPHEWEGPKPVAPQVQITPVPASVEVERGSFIEGDTAVENSPIAETFVTANEGSRRDEISPLAPSFTSNADSFVTAKEDNEDSDTETIKGGNETTKHNSADK